jgi:hypothetical protein
MERKKEEQSQIKLQERRVRSNLVWITMIMFLLFVGISVVDESTRWMMMLEEPRAFGHNKINDSLHELYICGEKVLVDEEEIKSSVSQMKNEAEVFFRVLIDKTDQLVKFEE